MTLEQKRKILGDLLAGGRVQVGWVKGATHVSLTLPAFRELPSVTARSDRDISSQIMGVSRAALDEWHDVDDVRTVAMGYRSGRPGRRRAATFRASVDPLDLARLKDKMHQAFRRLGAVNTHKTLPDEFQKLGLEEIRSGDDGLSKQGRVEAVFSRVPDVDLPAVAARYLELFEPTAQERNKIQELLWKDAPGPTVPERYRREVARSLSTEDLRTQGFMTLLESLWVLDKLIFDGFRRMPKSLGEDIARHVIGDPDYSPEEVFEMVGAYTCTHRRFVAFIEGLCSHRFSPDAAQQQRLAEAMNEPLRTCGVELVETGEDGGYPVYRALSKMAGASGRPKQVIFAPLGGKKPDLRFSDAVNSDVEVVSGAADLLMYDRPIPAEGLLWRDLQAWWAERENIPNDRQAKVSLYEHLLKSIPEDSPPQRALFRAFFVTFRDVFEGLPALLPEVHLHYDPKTRRERGPEALLRQRMDFLMLISHPVRVVIEVDGIQHYANKSTRLADVGLYARTMEADRELKLRGYEVFHFGGAELQGSEAEARAGDFFRRLLARYEVAVPS